MPVYEKSVQQLMKDFASDVRGVFRFADLRLWFRTRYPSIQETTLRAHLHAMTLGASQDWHQMPQIFERVGRGVYIPAREYRERSSTTPPARVDMPIAVDPSDRSEPDVELEPVRGPSTTAPDGVLVGCVKTKGAEPARAQDLYISDLFLKRRRYAEGAGVPWYILSAEHGLLRPTTLIEPYDVELKSQPAPYRHAWGAWVVVRLERQLGPLAGRVFEIHAGEAYVEALREPLRAAGASLARPLEGLAQGEQLAWYLAKFSEAVASTATGTSAAGPRQSSQQNIDSQVADLVGHLGDPEFATPVGSLDPSDVDARPGLYSWWVDPPGAEALAAGLGQPVWPGLIYAGQAGATRWPSGRRSTNTLRARLIEMHRDGAVSMSTFRLTLAAILGFMQPTGGADEGALSRWMRQHLSVSWMVVVDPDDLSTIERAVLAQLDPPFNLRDMAPSAVRAELSRRRSKGARRQAPPAVSQLASRKDEV